MGLVPAAGPACFLSAGRCSIRCGSDPLFFSLMGRKRKRHPWPSTPRSLRKEEKEFPSGDFGFNDVVLRALPLIPGPLDARRYPCGGLLA